MPAVSAALRAQIQRDLQAERSNDPCAQSKAGATASGATATLAAGGGSAKAVVPSRAAVAVGSDAAAVATKPGATVTCAAVGGSADAVVPSRAAVRSGVAVSKVGPGAHIRGGHRAQSKAVATKPGATVTIAAAGGSAVSRSAAAVATKPGATVTFAAAGGSAEAVAPSRAAVAVGSDAAAVATKPGATVTIAAAGGRAVSRGAAAVAQTKAVATRLGGSMSAVGGAEDVSATAPARRTADRPVVAPSVPVAVGSGDASSKLFLHSDENRVPPAVLEVVVDGAKTAQTHHVLEQPLGDEARVAAGRTVGVLHRTVPEPKRLFEATEADTAQMQQTRAVASVLDEFSPDLVRAPNNHRALIYEIARQRVAAGAPMSDTGALLAAGLDAFAKSTLPGASQSAKALRPPSRSARGVAGQLLASKRVDSAGQPIFVAHPQVGTTVKVVIGGEVFTATDTGHMIDTSAGLLENQCVVRALASSTGLDARDLWQALYDDAGAKLGLLGPQAEAVSNDELQLRRVIHDLTQRLSHDLFLVRFLLPNLFSTYRFIFICASTSGQVTVQVVESADFDPAADGALTRLVLAYNDHAYTLQPPSRFLKADAGTEMTPAGVQALLNRLESLQVPIATYHHVSWSDIISAPKDIPSEALEPCPCCQQNLLDSVPTRVGRGLLPDDITDGAASEVERAAAVLAAQSSLPGGVRRWVQQHAQPSAPRVARPINQPLPVGVQRWVAECEVVGGLSKALGTVYQNRSKDFQDHVITVEETREYPSSPETRAGAQAMLSAAGSAYRNLNCAAIKEKVPEEMATLAAGLKDVSEKGDQLIKLAGGVRPAVAAFRQAYLLQEGELPLNEAGLKHLVGLVGESELAILREVAAYGVPTLQAEESPPTEFHRPYKTAQAAASEVGVTALKDAAVGRAFLASGSSRESLAEARVNLSSLGAVPKKDATGQATGKVRATTDLRPLNDFIAKHLVKQYALSRFKAPGAYMPRLQRLMQNVVTLARRFPGVAIGGGKSDLSEAFKLMHVLLADVPAFGWELPLEGLEGLDKWTIYQLLLVLPFGWDKSPAWFNLLAWVLAQAHASMGPGEPQLNGGDSFAGGLPWVDDYVFLVALLGQRGWLAYLAYRALVMAAVGNEAINVEKDAIDGNPSQIFEPWGFLMDLTRIPEMGPLFGIVRAKSDKVVKFLKLLTDIGLDNVGKRRLTCKALAEVTGLAVWLAQTNSLLQALLPSFYNAMNSLDHEFVVPAGSAVAVNQVWAELEDAFYLAIQLCHDFKTFEAVFTASVTRALSPLDQVALGVPRLIWQSDATGHDPLLKNGAPVVGPDGKVVCAAAVYGIVISALNIWVAELVENYEALLQDVVGGDSAEHVVVAEMLPLVAAAMEHKEELRGFLITCLVDNISVVVALNKRASSHPFIRYLCLLLARLESVYGFQVVGYYINTKRNVVPDGISRMAFKKPDEEVAAFVHSYYPGFERRRYTALSDFLRWKTHSEARSFLINGELSSDDEKKVLEEGRTRAERRKAQVMQAAVQDGVLVREISPATGGFIELFGGVGSSSRVAVRLGLMCVAVAEPHLPSRSLAVARLREESQDPVVCSSIFDEDLLLLKGRGVELLLVGPAPPKKGDEPDALQVGLPALAEKLKPLVVCVEMVPDGGRKGDCLAARALIDAMGKAGYCCHQPPTGESTKRGLPFEVVDAAELGGGQQRFRAVLHFEPTCWKASAGPLAELRAAPGPLQNLGRALRPVAEIRADECLKGRFVHFKPPEDDSGTLPLLAGHLFTQDASVGVGVGSEVSISSVDEEERWTVVSLNGVDELVLEKKPRRGEPHGDRHIAQRSQVLCHHGRRLQVWHPKGVGVTVRASWEQAQAGPPLVYDARGDVPVVRRLNVQELWQQQGLTLEDLQLFGRLNNPGVAARQKGAFKEQELTAAGRATPMVLAEAVVGRALERLHALQGKLVLAPEVGDGVHFVRVESLEVKDLTLVRREDGTVEAMSGNTVRLYDPHMVGALVPNPVSECPTTRASGGKRYATGRQPAIAPVGLGVWVQGII